jgi:hypothetical protein
MRGMNTGHASKNLPLSMFLEDGNMQSSKKSLFIQAVDLVAYAAALKIKAELNSLTEWQREQELGSLYDTIQSNTLIHQLP